MYVYFEWGPLALAVHVAFTLAQENQSHYRYFYCALLYSRLIRDMHRISFYWRGILKTFLFTIAKGDIYKTSRKLYL